VRWIADFFGACGGAVDKEVSGKPLGYDFVGEDTLG